MRRGKVSGAPANPVEGIEAGVRRLEEGVKFAVNRLAEIDHKVDSMGQTHAFALRADSERMKDVVSNIFKSAKRKAQVYLAADGRRSVNEIAAHVGIPRQNVGRILSALRDADMLGWYSESGRDIWHKLPIDKTIGITRILTDQYGLDRDGAPAQERRKKKRG
jgi:hypothetical protein